MGVHGLGSFLQSVGLDAHATTISLPPSSTTLAIDGDGLIFHLLRLAYRQHRENVLQSSFQSQCQPFLLLPTFTPLSLVHDATTAYLSTLTANHGLQLKIYFDGPNQRMKGQELQRRRDQREEEWENTRQLCIHGTLPEKKPSKLRSSARRQAREYDRRCHSEDTNAAAAAAADDDDDAEIYFGSFPFSPLAMNQVESSILAFANGNPKTVQIMECDGEADAVVARASAEDATGTTYALANDTDYLVFGKSHDCGATRYIPFKKLDSNVDGACIATVLTRTDVAAAIGLPFPGAMIELSMLLGNDYTRPFVRHENMKKRNKYLKSIRWHRCHGPDNAAGTLPPDSELSLYDIQSVADHVAEKVADGWKLTSDMQELQVAMRFSYSLYTFGDISSFPKQAPGTIIKEGGIDKKILASPSLPRTFDISLVRGVSDRMDLADAALLPLTSFMLGDAVECNDLYYIGQRHIEAFRMTLEAAGSQSEQDTEPPQRRLQWDEMRALYILEKCLLKAIQKSDNSTHFMPCQVFDHSIFHRCLENLSFEDYPLDNELVAKNERAFLEEVTSDLAACKINDPVKNQLLPIDEHKDEILDTVKTQRVTIIHGETGCGKSSKVPCFLLRADPPQPTLAAPEVKMIISQPRRIAAKALAERVRSCEPDLAHKIGLRMGHGIREHETAATRAWFVTTGYVVRLLANHPSWFDSHTHLVIDEVHERSVDTDILCLLCRRLLQSHPTIRLILMSATMAAELYSQYFGSPQPPIHVGARRFKIKEYFVEDLKSLLSLPSKIAKHAHDVYTESERTRCLSAPSSSHMDKLYHLATQITASVGSNGSSVLIFVPGMADIEAITELIEKLNLPLISFSCLPIHSDVPFEEQMAAFEPPAKGEVKVVIATNAAESSVTLPDVDHVICLGLCKQIIYNQASHRQMLVPCWISRASATQRAGRTGRVREGNVYRLYSGDTFHKHMPAFESGEMVRIPLDSVILSLREMLGEAVTPILLDSLEPPDISTIERSFKSLHDSNFISTPTDEGEITSLGSLVVALGIDLTLGAFVGLGIQFGVAAEAIELAAILSFPKSPWAMTSPMYHDTITFNEIVSKTFVSRCTFDAGLYSEPMAISNLLHEYRKATQKDSFCWKNRVSSSRIRHLYGTVESLRRRVAECLSISSEVLETQEPPSLMPHAKINILRILHVWLFYETMISQPSRSKKEHGHGSGSIAIQLDGPPVGPEHLGQVLDAERHPFEIERRGKVIYNGVSNAFPSNNSQDLEIRFVSYVLEKKIDLSFYYSGKIMKVFVPGDIWDQPDSGNLKKAIIGNSSFEIEEVNYLQATGGNQRGVRGRACGAWYPIHLTNSSTHTLKSIFVLTSQRSLTKANVKVFMKHIDNEILNKIDRIKSVLSCIITESKKNSAFSVTSSGKSHEISKIDLCDLFAAPDLLVNVSTTGLGQVVTFHPANVDNDKEGHNGCHSLIQDAPEGARLLIVLASERRRDNFIRLRDGPNTNSKSSRRSDGRKEERNGNTQVDEEPEQIIDVNLSKKLSINNQRWKRKDGGGMVFVPENCVPAAAMPTDNNIELYACCANTLDLRGGASRVEGITMLPPGRLFVGLALLSFGINPKTFRQVGLLDIDEYGANEVDTLVKESVSWISDKDKSPLVRQAKWRVEEALDFHAECMELGEVLVCQPDKIKRLCDLFNEVDGHSMTVWKGYDAVLTDDVAFVRPKSSRKTSQKPPPLLPPPSLPQSNTQKKEASHLRKEATAPDNTGKSLHCKLCNVQCPNESSLQQHKRGKAHKRIAIGNKCAQNNLTCGQRECDDGSLATDTTSGTPRSSPETSQKQPSSLLPPPSTPTSNTQPFYCDLCKIECNSYKVLQLHYNGKSHLKKEAGALGNNEFSLQHHQSSKVHNRIAAGNESAQNNFLGRQEVLVMASDQPMYDSNLRRCRICNISCPNEKSYQQHVSGKIHKKKTAAVRVGSLFGEEVVSDDTRCLRKEGNDMMTKGDSNRAKQSSVPNEMNTCPPVSYMCKGCSDTFETWEKCLFHMKRCCLGLIAVDVVPKNYAKKKKSSYVCKCGVEFAKWGLCLDHMTICCLGDMPDAMELICSQDYIANKNNNSKRSYMCKGKGCGEEFEKWGKCISHMGSCGSCSGHVDAITRSINPKDFVPFSILCMQQRDMI